MNTAAIQRERPRLLLLVIFALVALVGFISIGSMPANANDQDSENMPFAVQGNVTYKDEPLAGVTFEVSGNGFNGTGETDEKGFWKVGLPEKGDYEVRLVGETLPEGVVVEPDDGGRYEVDVNDGVTKVTVLQAFATTNFFLGQGERISVSMFDQVVERLFNGLNFGLLLGLAAIGASLIFGTTGLSNFAHGEMVTFGALAALTFTTTLALPVWLSFILAIILAGVLGYLLDLAIWRPLRKKGVGIVQVMIVSIGLSLALRYVFQFFYGGSTKQLPGSQPTDIPWLGAIKVSVVDLVSMGISIVVILAFAWWLLKTRIGKATRAISDNPALAAASGINVDRVVRIVWVIAAALAGFAGILWAYFRPGVSWNMGTAILLLIFAAITLGGLGTAFGALIGSIIVGLLVEMSTLWIPSDMKYVGALFVMILVLMFRPQGLLGRKERIG